jgi:outer membrane biosynthesis protein TonB
MGRIAALAAIAVASLAGCASRPAEPRPATVPPPAPAAARPGPPAVPVTLDDYKRRLAGRIVSSSAKIFHEPLPPTMKSIVVLYIRLDSRGRPLRVAVFRSNGYRALEQRAVASVVDAVPLPAPPSTLLDDTNSLGFLETFLFRDDGLFQVRSLVGETWQATSASP